MNFGQKLKVARLGMNLTQQKIADDFFITRQTISSWENGNSYPDIMTLIKLSDYFKFSIDEILREDKQMRLFLEKQTVKKNLKPIYRNILVIVSILLVVNLLDLFNVIKLGWIGWVIWIVFLLNVRVLFMLNKFDASNTMDFKYTWQKKTKNLLAFIIIK